MSAAERRYTVSNATLAERRTDFPILHQEVHGKPLVYLDNAATTQKPLSVLQAMDSYYRAINANIHRGVHTLSERATAAYEAARDKVQRFINARDRREIVFVRGTTDAINLVAQSFGRSTWQAGDEIIITAMEHHSNIVPWQLVCEQTGAVLKVLPIDDNGELMMTEFAGLLTERTRLVAVVHVSNALGTVNPIGEIIQIAHQAGVPVLIDGAQAVAHMPVDVQALDCDFYAFSGHKLFGPTGIGVLYGKAELLNAMPPYQGGGDMIKMVSFTKTLYNDLPYKFEAGTPPIAEVIGLGAAIDYVQDVGLAAIASYEHELLAYAEMQASTMADLRIIGTAKHKSAILSFVLRDIHPHDLGTILDSEGVAIRTGHHCAMPIMERFGVPATARASFAFYNTHSEIDQLFLAIVKAREIMR